MAADAAANALVPGSGIVLKGVRSFGDASQEARRDGATVGQQVAYGALTAGIKMWTEKKIDGLAGAYGEGVSDSKLEKDILDKFPNLSQKTASRIVDTLGEAAKPVVNYLLETPLKSIYNNTMPLENYTADAWHDALRDAVIQGVTSNAINAWSDAQNWALNRAYEEAINPQTQARLRKKYVGTTEPSIESDVAFLREMLSKKGNGHRW